MANPFDQFDATSGNDFDRFDAPASPPSTVQQDKVPEWAGQYPNAYASLMTMLDLAPQVANVTKSSGIGIPVAGGLNALSQATKRAIDGQPTTMEKVVNDALVGMGGQAFGDVVGKGLIPVLAKAIPESFPKWMYRSALKPRTTIPVQERANMVTRGLSEGITLDQAGWDKLLANIANDRSSVMRIINQGSARGETIPAQSVINEFNLGGDKSMSYLANTLQNDAPEVASLLAGRSATIRNNGPYIDVKKAQTLKEHYQNQASYPNDTRGMYGEQLDQATARGLRKALESKYQDIVPLNAANSERSALAEQLLSGGTLGRVENRDPTGLGLTMATNMADPSNPLSQANFVARVVQNFPKGQAKIAIEVYKSKTGKTLPIKKYRQAVRFLANEELQRTLNQENNAPQESYMSPAESAMLTTDNDPLGLRNAQ